MSGGIENDMDNIGSTDGQLRELALFAGAGGGILGGKLLGWKTVCAVEINPYCQRVLCERQADGTFDPFPIWDDICTFDGKPWRGLVDVVSGGFPCQDISAANQNAVGISGDRSGLWSEMARIIDEIRPGGALIENSPMLVSRGLDRVLSDLAEMGMDARWGIFPACREGAPHTRERLFILAYSNESVRQRLFDKIPHKEGWADESAGSSGSSGLRAGRGWETEPRMGRVVNGVAHRLHRVEALGNGQVPRVVVRAWNELVGEM